MSASVRLIGEKGLLYLLARARDLGITLQGCPPRHAADLRRLEIFQGAPDSARRYANGRYALTKAHADHIRARLKISQADWDSITEPASDEPPEVDTHNLRKFLNGLRSNGLDSAVAFSPRHVPDLDLAAFCVPVRVITDDEWNTLTGEYRGSGEPQTGGVETLVARRAAGVFLNGWLRRGHRRVVIKGEPGEGKTTALWLYVAELCASCIRSFDPERTAGTPVERGIPLLLPLGRIGGAAGEARSVIELALEHVLSLVELAPAAAQEVRNWLTREVEGGNYLLLLDALDELPAEHLPWLRKELLRLPDVPVVLTTRYHADPASVFRHYTLLRIVPLRWWVIDEFVTRYFAEHPHGTRLANRLRRTFRLTPTLAQLAQNPLLLGVMCHLQANDEEARLPTTKSGLLHAALGSLLRRGDARRGYTSPRPLRDEAKIGVLSQVAWQFQHERVLPMAEDALLKVLDTERKVIAEEPPVSARALLDEFMQDGALVGRGGNAYNFMLRRFQEYCLARHIAGMAAAHTDSGVAFQGLVRGRAKAWGRSGDWTDFRPLNQPGWAEVWPLVAGCMGSDPALVEALVLERESTEDLVSSRLRLLARALAEFLEANRDLQAVLNRWRPLADSVTEAVLDLVGTEPPVTGLPGSWRSCLAQIPPTVTVPKVVARIGVLARDPHAASVYAIALGEIGSPDARQHLQRLLGMPGMHDKVRANAAIGLGLVGDATARRELLRCLDQSRDTNTVVYFGCIVGLAYVADQPSREALAEVLQADGNAEGRWQCLRECERLFGPEIEKTLLRLLERNLACRAKAGIAQEDIDEISEQSAMVLGRIGSPPTARRMLQLLGRPAAPFVRRHICNAVAEIGDDASRQVLRNLALGARRDPELAAHATVALIGVGDEELLPHLLETCSHPKCPTTLREAAAAVCHDCGSDLVPQFLAERLLQDPSPRVKFSAAVGLGRHGSPLALDALRQALALAMPEDIRFQCALDLAVSGDEEGVKRVIGTLADRAKDPQFRLAAMNALGRMNREDARAALRRVYEDRTEPPPIRTRCLDSLAVIQRQQGWRPLRNGGWEAP